MKKLIVAIAITLAGLVAWGLEGEPIPGADVKVGRRPPRSGTIVAQGSTDEHGSIVFKDLADDTYFVRITIGETTHEVTENEAGDKIRAFGARTARRGPSIPLVITETYGDVTATIEVVDDSIKVSLGKQLNAQQSRRR
jgi:hypothetical protein